LSPDFMHLMWKIFSTEDLCKSILSDPEFLTGLYNKIDTFFKGVNLFMSIIYTFIVRTRWNSV